MHEGKPSSSLPSFSISVWKPCPLCKADIYSDARTYLYIQLYRSTQAEAIARRQGGRRRRRRRRLFWILFASFLPILASQVLLLLKLRAASMHCSLQSRRVKQRDGRQLPGRKKEKRKQGEDGTLWYQHVRMHMLVLLVLLFLVKLLRLLACLHGFLPFSSTIIRV